MSNALIAVAVLKNGTISPHAGRAARWQVYAISNGAEPQLVWSLELTAAGSLHEWHVNGDGNRHPLHGVDVAIVKSAGEGVTRRLAERDTVLVTTSESDPLTAIGQYLDGTLPAGKPHDEAECLDPEHHREVSS